MGRGQYRNAAQVLQGENLPRPPRLTSPASRARRASFSEPAPWNYTPSESTEKGARRAGGFAISRPEASLSRKRLDIQSHGAHQRQRVALLHHSFAHQVVKRHGPVFKVVL